MLREFRGVGIVGGGQFLGNVGGVGIVGGG